MECKQTEIDWSSVLLCAIRLWRIGKSKMFYSNSTFISIRFISSSSFAYIYILWANNVFGMLNPIWKKLQNAMENLCPLKRTTIEWMSRKSGRAHKGPQRKKTNCVLYLQFPIPMRNVQNLLGIRCTQFCFYTFKANFVIFIFSKKDAGAMLWRPGLEPDSYTFI
jgi:hypothetical protein